MFENAPSVHIETNFFIRASGSQYEFKILKEFTKHSFNPPAFWDTPCDSATFSNIVCAASHLLQIYPFRIVERIQPLCFCVWIAKPSINTLRKFKAKRLVVIFQK